MNKPGPKTKYPPAVRKFLMDYTNAQLDKGVHLPNACAETAIAMNAAYNTDTYNQGGVQSVWYTEQRKLRSNRPVFTFDDTPVEVPTKARTVELNFEGVSIRISV